MDCGKDIQCDDGVEFLNWAGSLPEYGDSDKIGDSGHEGAGFRGAKRSEKWTWGVD